MSQPHAGTNKRRLSHIQRLCCLGVGSEMLMPDLLQEVAGLMRARHQAFRWAGPNGEIVNDCSSFPPAHTELYLKEFNGSRQEAEVIKPFSTIKTSINHKPVFLGEETLLVDLHTFTRSEYYNALWRASNIHHQLGLSVRDAVRNHGRLYVYRAADDAPFKPSDIKMLEAIGGFVAHSMTAAPLSEDAFAETDDRALCTVKFDGTIQHATENGQRLLMMALNQSLPTTVSWRGLGKPAPEVVRLCHALAATADGQIGQPPPVRRLRNVWGEFVLRAYWLGPTDGIEQTRYIGIIVERRISRALAIFRRVEELPLTTREKQLCQLLMQDPSRRDLADTMGLANSTAITHQRSIYTKLGIHSRAGLIAALQPA